MINVMTGLLSRYWLHLLAIGLVAYSFKYTYDSGVDSERDRWEKNAYQSVITAHEVANTFTAGVLSDHQEIQDDAQIEIELLKNQLAAADSAYDSLHDNAKSYAKRAADSSRAAANCKATEAANRVFADMLKESDRLAGVYAKHADESRIAGQACEKSYEVLADWIMASCSIK